MSRKKTMTFEDVYGENAKPIGRRLMRYLLEYRLEDPEKYKAVCYDGKSGLKEISFLLGFENLAEYGDIKEELQDYIEQIAVLQDKIKNLVKKYDSAKDISDIISKSFTGENTDHYHCWQAVRDYGDSINNLKEAV